MHARKETVARCNHKAHTENGAHFSVSLSEFLMQRAAQKESLLLMYTDLLEVSISPVAPLQRRHKSVNSQWVTGDAVFAEAAKS